MKISTRVLPTLLVVCALSACGIFDSKVPIPEDKRAFIGVWKTSFGFTLDLRENGAAYLKQVGASGSQDFDAVTIPLAPLNSTELEAHFRGDSTILIIKPSFYAKEYRITRAPYQEGNRMKMMLNSVAFIKD
jgi:hypothetical protein